MNSKNNNIGIFTKIGIFFLLTIGIVFLITFSCSSDESEKIDVKLIRLEKKIEKFDKIEKNLKKREKDLEKREKELLDKSKNNLNNQKSKEKESSIIENEKSNEKSFEYKMLEEIKKDEQQQKNRESLILFKKKNRFNYITKQKFGVDEPYGRNCVIVYDNFFETYTIKFINEYSNSVTYKLKRSDFKFSIPKLNIYSFEYQDEFYNLSDSKK